MITPFLERAILLGKGVSKSHAFGFSQLGVIKIPEYKIGIITDFTYYNFLPLYKNGGMDLAEKCFTMLQIDSQKSVHNYIFRNDYLQKYLPDQRFGYTPNGSSKIDCYIVSDSNIKIRLSVMQPIINGSFTSNIPNNKVNEPPNPLGYQNTAVTSVFQFMGGTFYAPQSVELTDVGDRDQAYNNFQILSAQFFNDNPEISIADQCPAINFNLVILDKDITEDLQANK